MSLQGPPRMAMFRFEGREHFVSLPVTFEKAIAAANDLFKVNAATQFVRLSVPSCNVPWIGGYATQPDVYIFDADSYAYACAMKHVVPFDVHVVEKNPPKPAAPPANAAAKEAAPAAGKSGGDGGGKGSGGGGGKDGGGGGGGGAGGAAPKAAPKKDEPKKEEPKKQEPKKEEPKKPEKPIIKTAPFVLSCKTTAGKTASVSGTLTGELAKGPGGGKYLGVMEIDGASHAQSFDGQQLPADHVITDSERYHYFGKLTTVRTQDKSTARLLFRPRSTRPQIDVYSHESRSLDVTLSVKDWQITAAYPMTKIRDEKGRQTLRWFLAVKPNGVVKDLLTYAETSGVFAEMIPTSVAKPKDPKPDGPLVPAWPDVSTKNSRCLPQEHFVPHMERVLASLGLPPQSSTSMITGWLPSATRHKNIAYRILSKDQLEPSIALDLSPRPQVLIRIFVLWRGIPDSEMKQWKDEKRIIEQHEQGLDWRKAVGYVDCLNDESLFRVIEYASMEVN